MKKLFVRLDELTALVGLSKSTIYSLINEGKFPRQKRLARRAVGWSVEEVTQWARETEEIPGVE
ncbi:MAG: helix-turn-helix transcriptional regulator [Candidatus Azotimanducaceae bacterium]